VRDLQKTCQDEDFDIWRLPAPRLPRMRWVPGIQIILGRSERPFGRH